MCIGPFGGGGGGGNNNGPGLTDPVVLAEMEKLLNGRSPGSLNPMEYVALLAQAKKNGAAVQAAQTGTKPNVPPVAPPPTPNPVFGPALPTKRVGTTALKLPRR